MQALEYSGFWLTPGTLYEDQMTAAYAIEDFPRQPDMGPGIDWLRPNSESDIVERGVEMIESLNGRLFALGGPSFKWHWQGLTSGMVAYLMETVMGGNPSAIVTLRTWDRSRNAWRMFNAVAQVRLYKDAGEADMGGFKRLEMNFASARPIAKRIVPLDIADGDVGIPLVSVGFAPAATARAEAFGTATVT